MITTPTGRAERQLASRTKNDGKNLKIQKSILGPKPSNMGFLKLFRIDVFLYGSLQGPTSKFSEKPTALLSKWEKTLLRRTQY